MKLSAELINLIFLLAPGFLAVIIFNVIAVRKFQSPFITTLEAIVFFFFIYISVTAFTEWNSIGSFIETKNAHDLSSKYSFTSDSTLLSISLVLFFSILYPIICTIVLFRNWHMSILRHFNVTDQTARDSTWLDVFTDEKREVTLDLKDGTTLYGHPRYYSSNYEEGFLYIEHPSWVNIKTEGYEDINQESEPEVPVDENTELEVEADNPYVDCTTTHGILINRADIHLIHFMKTPTEIKATNGEINDNQNE